MARIPYQGGLRRRQPGRHDRAHGSRPFDRPSYVLPAQFPRTSDDLKVDACRGRRRALGTGRGCRSTTASSSPTKMWQFLTSCEERRLVEYERINWWDFIEAGARSAAYQKYFGNGITRSLVAAKARRASTKTIGDIFVADRLRDPAARRGRRPRAQRPDQRRLDQPLAGVSAATGRRISLERRRARDPVRAAASSAARPSPSEAVPRGDGRLLHRRPPGRADGGAGVAGLLEADPRWPTSTRSPSTSSG